MSLGNSSAPSSTPHSRVQTPPNPDRRPGARLRPPAPRCRCRGRRRRRPAAPPARGPPGLVSRPACLGRRSPRPPPPRRAPAGRGWRAPRALPAVRRDAGPAPRAHHVLPAGLPVPGARLAGAILVPGVRRVGTGGAAQRGAGSLGVGLGVQPLPGLRGLHRAGGHGLRQPAAVLGRRCRRCRRLPILHGNGARAGGRAGRGTPGRWRSGAGDPRAGPRGTCRGRWLRSRRLGSPRCWRDERPGQEAGRSAGDVLSAGRDSRSTPFHSAAGVIFPKSL